MYFFTSSIPQELKNVYHLIRAILANVWHGFPSRRLKVIGVTGTDGKTTTSQLIARIFEEAGHRVALASTINFRIAGEERVNTSKFTTMASFATQKFLRQAADAGCEYVVLETGSHALDQHRVWGIRYETAVITNVTREHLDYHKTMDRYRRAKKRLFDHAKIVVVNLDMEDSGEFLRGNHEKKITYSIKDPLAQVFAKNIGLRLDGSTFEVDGHIFNLLLPGTFNIENALAAVGAGLSQGVDMETIARAIASVHAVPGRMESIPNDRGLIILIDYAVTPNALEKLYTLVSSMKPSETSKIVSVFGACGDRDRGKRPIMGRIVSAYADVVILTNEDPYHENPERILDEIEKGIEEKEKEKDFFRIMDRREAIAKALAIAIEGDVIVVTGKGAEETMAVGENRVPWNDKRVILELLTRR